MKSIKFIYPREITVVTGGHRYEKSLRDTLSQSGMTVETLSIFQKKSPLSKFDRLCSPLLALKLLKKLDRRNDIVVLNSTTGLYFLLLSVILRLCKVSTVIIHHHYLYKEFTGLKRHIYHSVENAFLKSASYIVTPSPYIKDLIKKEISGDSILLPIPFRRPDSDIDCSPNVGQLLYIGTIEERKGLNLLIESLHLLNHPEDYTLVVVGKTRNEKYKESLNLLIKRYNLRVIFHGFLSDDELNEIKEKSDIFVFPSLLEGFGMAINEVKFYGLPVVCFDNSAMPYSTTNGVDGYVVKNKDTADFSKAIERIVNDRSLRDELSKNALRKAKALYSPESFKKDSYAIFSSFA